MKNHGFTLVEIIVVLGITISIAVIVVQALSGIFRGSAKSTVLSEVKQNGSYALSVMETMIRNAEPTPACIQPTGAIRSGVLIVNRGNDNTGAERTTKFVCIHDGSKVVLASASGILPTYAPLTNSSVQVVGPCVFGCSAASAYTPARVTIQFSLAAFMPNVTLRAQENASEMFSTSVTQRSYR